MLRLSIKPNVGHTRKARSHDELHLHCYTRSRSSHHRTTRGTRSQPCCQHDGQSGLPLAHAGIDRLTDREREVIIHVGDPDQRTCEVIADDLHMHRGTFQVHIASIFEKLDVGNRGGLVRVAILNGLDREE